MQTGRIDSFTIARRRFVCFDLSNIKTNEELVSFVVCAKEHMRQYKPLSVYTITNVEGMIYDTAVKNIIVEFMQFMAQYVIKGAIVRVEGMRKISFSSILEAAKRDNLVFANTKQEAIEYLSDI